MRRGFRYYFDVELFDLALLFGMTPDEYWFGDPAMLENYAHLYESRRKQADEDAWAVGRYVLSALQSRPVPVWLVLSDKCLKNMPEYPQEPLLSKEESQQPRLSEEEIRQRNADLERIKMLKAMYTQSMVKSKKQGGD